MTAQAFTVYAEGLYSSLSKQDMVESRPRRMFAKAIGCFLLMFFGGSIILIIMPEQGYSEMATMTGCFSIVALFFWMASRSFLTFNLFCPLRKAFFDRRLTALLQELCDPGSRVLWSEPKKRKFLTLECLSRHGIPFTTYYHLDALCGETGMIDGELVSFQTTIHPFAYRFFINTESILPDFGLDIDCRSGDGVDVSFLSKAIVVAGEVDPETLLPKIRELLQGTRLKLRFYIKNHRLEMRLFDTLEKVDMKTGEPQLARFAGFAEQENRMASVKGLEPILELLVTGKTTKVSDM